MLLKIAIYRRSVNCNYYGRWIEIVLIFYKLNYSISFSNTSVPTKLNVNVVTHRIPITIYYSVECLAKNIPLSRGTKNR